MTHGAHAARAIVQLLVLNRIEAFHNLELDAAKAARELAAWSERGLLHQPVAKLAKQGWRKAARVILFALLSLLWLRLIISLGDVINGVDAC